MSTYLPDILALSTADALLMHVDGDVRIAGPGDALRFVHALRILFDAGCVTRVRCLKAELARLAGLVSGKPVFTGPSCDDGHVTWFSDSSAEAKVVRRADGKALGLAGLNPLIQSLGSATAPVLHVHIGHGLSSKSLIGTLIAGKALRARVQIAANRLLRCPRIALPLRALPAERACGARPRIGVFLRRIPKGAKVDAPDHFLRTIAAVHNIDRIWFGLVSQGDYNAVRRIPVNEATLPYGAKTYLEQAQALRELDGAVGYNSGGLDLAAAAGIPVLRIGEYQRCGRGGRKSGSHRSQPWRSASLRLRCSRLPATAEPLEREVFEPGTWSFRGRRSEG